MEQRGAERKSIECLTVAELAKVLRVKERTVRDWVNRDAIPFVRLGRLIRFRRSDLEVWLDERREGGEFHRASSGQ